MSGSTIALAWLLFSGFMVLLIFGQNLSAGTPTDWREALGGRLLHGLIWGLLTPVVFALAARFNLTERRHRLPHLLAHAAASYVLTLVYRLGYAAVMHGSGATPGGFFLHTVVANANNWVPIYWMLLCIAYAVQYRERYREGRVRAAQLETQLVQAQLQALKMQLQPHFLFNSMNAVSALMTALLLHPVVENAVRHGLAPRAGSGELAVRAEKQGDRLLLQVHDNGQGAADTAARGIGLRNLESRLATLYGPDYALAVESAPACGYCLRLSIPFRLAAAGTTPVPA
ncbi:MAG: hypothetical protein NVS3B25_31470 [Hymenobacter sp.]